MLKRTTFVLLFLGASFSALIVGSLLWSKPNDAFNFHQLPGEDDLLATVPSLEAALAAESQPHAKFVTTEPLGPGAQRSAACLRMSGLAAVGSIEAWFWTLAGTAFESDRLFLYAVSLERAQWTHAYFYSAASFQRLHSAVPRVNPSSSELQERCSVIVTTEVGPPVALVGSAAVPSVLVIHGSDDYGTQEYARYIHHYDAVVCVSAECAHTFQATADAAGVPLQVIPTAVRIGEFTSVGDPQLKAKLREQHGLPPTRKVLGFLGAISSENGAQFFVDVARELPSDWIAVMAGLNFFEGSMPTLHSKVKYLGAGLSSAELLAMVDAVLLPSTQESGSMELLQVWAAKVPLFTRSTGLAAAHPGAVVDIGPQGAKSPGQVVALILDSLHSGPNGNAATAVADGFAAVTSRFSTDAVSAQYGVLLDNLVRCGSRDEVWLDPKPAAALIGRSAQDTQLPLMERTAVLQLHGKQAQLECVHAAGCSFLLTSAPPPACATTNWLPKFLRVEFELFEQSSELREALQVAVRVMFAASTEDPLPREKDMPTAVPTTLHGGKITVQHAVPGHSGSSNTPFSGVARLHVQVPPFTRLHVAHVEWRGRSAL